MRQIKITVTVQQEGQSRRYGDSEYVYKIDVEGKFQQDNVLRFCREYLNAGGTDYDEWNEVQMGRVFETHETAATYFGGYYKFDKISEEKDSRGIATKASYAYKVVIPYCD